VVQEDDVHEAVIRYLADGWKNDDRVFFISLEGKDPSDGFILRLKDLGAIVKKASESKDVAEDKSFFSHVRDRETGKPGVVFSVGKIQWLSATTAEVDGSYRCGSLCGGGSRYKVSHKNSGWKVTPGNSSWNA
jgi:hypothetical protein